MTTAAATNFKQLLFFRAAEGLGETFYFPASMSLISDYHGKRSRSRAMGTHQTSVYIGTIAGGFFGGLISQFFGWRSAFIVFSGMGVLLGFVLAKLLVEPERGAADLEDFGVRKHTEHRMSAVEFLKVIWTTPTVCLYGRLYARQLRGHGSAELDAGVP
jgi:MFS family permease